MSVHEKLAAFIALGSCGHVRSCGHESCEQLLRLSRDIARGDLDDILGVREPTIEEVWREAVRVFGAGFDPYRTTVFSDGWVLLPLPYREEVRVPSISAAYAALRTMKDYEVEK